MSSKPRDQLSSKRKVFDDLIYEVRRSQNATDRFDQAVADTIGINRTDLRCLDVIQREWPVAAGRLAERDGADDGRDHHRARPSRACRIRAPCP